MQLELSEDELAQLRAVEKNCAKHISVVNDIYSFEKEVIAAKEGHMEGAFLCSAVKVVANETSLSFPATKRVLWAMVREWEFVHDAMCDEIYQERCDQRTKDYLRGLQYQMSGNELWSRTTPRYLLPAAAMTAT